MRHGRDVAASQTDDGLKVIVGNTVMINAYKDGIPRNGKPFSEGSIVVKVSGPKKNPVSAYSVMVPDTLKLVAFIGEGLRFISPTGLESAQLVV